MVTPDWHALLALGTLGGEPCLDGDRLARGVHLLWSIRPELGFPTSGYQVYRRAHAGAEWLCLQFEHVTPPDGPVWVTLGCRLEASPGPIELVEFACGKLPGIHLSGEQTLRIEFPGHRIAVRASGTGEPPEVEIFVRSGGEDILAARVRASPAPAGSWTFEYWAEGIVAVRFAAIDLRLCSLCLGGAVDGGRWNLLNDRPILMPVVPPGTANVAAEIHDPANTRTVARARLSRTLPTEVSQKLAGSFAREIRELAEGLLRDGAAAKLPATASQAASARTPPSLRLANATLLSLAALDPDVSRMLGLYWHDPVDDGRYDYKVVARHGSVRYPGHLVDFTGLATAPVAGHTLTIDGLTFVGNEGLEVAVLGTPSGARLMLRILQPRAGTVSALRLARPAPALSLRLAGSSFVTFTAWNGRIPVSSAVAVAGEAVLENAQGIDAVTWTTDLKLLEVEVHREAGLVSDLTAYAWNVGPGLAPQVRRLTVSAAAGGFESTRLLDDGSADRATGVIGLDWSVANDALDVVRPVRVQVAASNRGEGETPVGAGPFVVRNAGAPALAFARVPGGGGRWPGPDVPRRWTERGHVPGWSAWRVRGIDAFGRLGDWSAERLVELRPTAAPPAPDAVTARYLDAADPHLSSADRALADADGEGLLVEWSWPAERRIRAPQVESVGEFRVYVRRGDPNLLQGTVSRAEVRADRTHLLTDLEWRGSADALAGELLRAGGASFPIVAHGTGARVWIDVKHLADPARRAAAGPFAINLSAEGAAHVDLTDPRAFEYRVHAAPAGTPPRLTTRVASVVKQGQHALVSLAEPLSDGSADLLPGRLVVRGVAFPVVSQSPGSNQVRIRGVLQPDATTELPGVGDACTLWVGARYRAWLPGFVLRPREREAVARGLVAVTASDGDPESDDDPVWSRPERGSLGGRPGRESRASRVARIDVPHRTSPPAVTVVRPPEVDGDIPADHAEPADWYGRARYTLVFEMVAGAVGYRVLRASTAALFERDRILRQTGAAPYTGGPFDDGGASAAWLAENHPSVSVADLTSDLKTHSDAAAVLAAWRGWAHWYYPALLNKEVMELADEVEGTQDAFHAAHPGTIPGPPFRDTLDGRGLGRFIYRVRSVDASGNAGAWSRAFRLVEVRDVTPPATPRIVTAAGYDRLGWLCWRRGGEPDLAGYRVWRAADDPDALASVHRLEPLAEVSLPTEGDTVAWSDPGLEGLRRYYYRVAAVDVAGNVSEPTPVLGIRVTDSQPPAPPAWERAEWAVVDRSGREVIALAWLAAEPVASATVERKAQGDRTWQPIATLVAPVDATDPASGDARRYRYQDASASSLVSNRYRIRLRTRVGAINLAFDEVEVQPA